MMWLSRCLIAITFSLTAACVNAQPASSRPIAAIAPVFQEGQIIDTATGEAVSLDQVMARLLQQDVIYFGEEHHNRHHIDAALIVLHRLVAEGRQPLMAMEMFGWDGQPVIDRYLSTAEADRKEFLDHVGWQHNWGGPFEDYEPLVQFARDRSLSLVAMNPPKSLIRTVAKQGLDQARRGSEMAQWSLQDETIEEDPIYRARILQQLRACHDGGSDAMYRTMYEASMVRDEGMAKVIASHVERLRTKPFTGPVVSYTGGGHIQLNLPVPKRVARRLDHHVRQVSIYMTSFEKERISDIQDMVGEQIADYVWLTAVSVYGSPRRCR